MQGVLRHLGHLDCHARATEGAPLGKPSLVPFSVCWKVLCGRGFLWHPLGTQGHPEMNMGRHLTRPTIRGVYGCSQMSIEIARLGLLPKPTGSLTPALWGLPLPPSQTWVLYADFKICDSLSLGIWLLDYTCCCYLQEYGIGKHKLVRHS